ncbi:MAG: hypothetical protein AAGU27_14775 [Dehalobacterium sp.]
MAVSFTFKGSMWSVYKLTRLDLDKPLPIFEGQTSALIRADADKADDVSTNNGAVIAVSGNNNVSALVYDNLSEAPLQDIKDKIKYLKIDLENNNNKIETVFGLCR